MKKTNRITIGFSALVLVCVVAVAGISASATGGDQTDPLVTLSYLTQVVKPELMQKVDEKVAENETALSEKLDTAIDEYSAKMEQALTQGGGNSSSYIVISLSAGQVLVPEAGSEILLCSGAANVTSDSAGGLMNTTEGTGLDKAGSLKLNNLYVVPLAETGITASTDSVILIRGDYIIF